MAIYNMGFVLEQALGHVTHAKNLQVNVPKDPDVRPHWALVDFDVTGASARIPVFKSNWTVRSGVRARRQLRAMAKTTKLDALFFHTQVPAVLAQRWLHRIPSIVSLDATPLQYDEFGEFYKHPRGATALENLKWRLNRDCYKAARHLVTWGDWTKRDLVKNYQVPPEKVTVVPPGVNVGDWRRPTPRVIEAGPVRVLFVGGDLERKGGLLLLEAFRALKHLGVELHLVTKAKLAPEPGLFVYNAMEPNSQPLKDLFHRCDIFALPTYGDTFAMVLSEAGASGLPIISTNLAAIPELVRDGDTGIIVPTGDTGALTAALRGLIENPERRLTLGARAMAHVEINYDAVKNTQRLLALLKQQADAGRARTP